MCVGAKELPLWYVRMKNTDRVWKKIQGQRAILKSCDIFSQSSHSIIRMLMALKSLADLHIEKELIETGSVSRDSLLYAKASNEVLEKTLEEHLDPQPPKKSIKR